MGFVYEHQWTIFIVVEALSWLMLFLFGVSRYLLQQKKASQLFIFLFIAFIAMEAILAIIVYQKTGVISNFQVIIIIFVLYACTFGMADFRKLDRWMRKKIGEWRGLDLLTDQDKQIIRKEQDPKFIAKRYRISSIIHTIIFLSIQLIIWWYGTGSMMAMIPYITDFSWYGVDDATLTPYPNDWTYNMSMVWFIVFAIDFVWSWSYTIFPASHKQ